MLARGYRAIPVVDEGGRLLGDVSLADVEQTMEGGDAHISDVSGGSDDVGA